MRTCQVRIKPFKTPTETENTTEIEGKTFKQTVKIKVRDYGCYHLHTYFGLHRGGLI